MKVTWTVTPVGYQRIAKRCPSCSVKRDFTPSGAIWVNAQKKVLDIWSIYKCTHCDYTWNISLISGVTMKMLKSRKLKAAEYKFQLSAETLYAKRRIVLTRR